MKLLLIAAVCLVGAGCADQGATTASPDPTTPTAIQTPGAAAVPGGGKAFIPAESLEALQKTYDQAKAAYTKDPKKNAKAFADAAYNLGAKLEYSDKPSHVKYPGALKLFREAAKADPTNQEAKDGADMIVSIYKQMGKPIPGGE